MTEHRLVEFVKEAKSWVETVISGGGEFTPTLVVEDKEGAKYVMVSPFTGETDEDVDKFKTRVANMQRIFIHANRGVRYIFISEAWMLRLNSPDELITQPSKSDRKIEVVTFVGQDVDGSSIHYIPEIIREPNTPAHLADVAIELMESGETVEGRFTNLFASPEARDNEFMIQISRAIMNVQEGKDPLDNLDINKAN